jgi:hypothetical protein
MPTLDDLELPEELHGLEDFVLEEAVRMVERSGVAPTSSAYREAIGVVVYGARVRIAEAEAINALAG